MATFTEKYFINQWLHGEKNKICEKCHENRNCLESISKLELEQYLKDLSKEIYGETLVINLWVKTGSLICKIGTGQTRQ